MWHGVMEGILKAISDCERTMILIAMHAVYTQ